MVLLVVLGVQLGMWQIRRADYKKSVALEILAKGQEKPIRAGMDLVGVDDMFRPIQATGVWLSDQAIWLANRPHPKGRDPKTGITTGFFLLMPLQIKDSPKEIVWVNRGWGRRSFPKSSINYPIASITSSSPLIAGPSPKEPLIPSSLATKKDPLPGPTKLGRGILRRSTGGLFFWMKSPRCRWEPRPAF